MNLLWSYAFQWLTELLQYAARGARIEPSDRAAALLNEPWVRRDPTSDLHYYYATDLDECARWFLSRGYVSPEYAEYVLNWRTAQMAGAIPFDKEPKDEEGFHEQRKVRGSDSGVR